MGSPLPSGHCKGLVAVGHFFGRDLACGVSGMPLPGYVTMFHTSWKVHVLTTHEGPELPTRLGMQGIGA